MNQQENNEINKINKKKEMTTAIRAGLVLTCSDTQNVQWW